MQVVITRQRHMRLRDDEVFSGEQFPIAEFIGEARGTQDVGAIERVFRRLRHRRHGYGIRNRDIESHLRSPSV
jgi:hypothetical protein